MNPGSSPGQALEHQLAQQLKALRLGGFLETLELRLKQAQEDELSPLTFLQLMVQSLPWTWFRDELERREARKLAGRLAKACFEEEKTLEGFDFSFNSKIKRPLVQELSTCLYLEKKEHVLIYGPSGVGKTHIAQALGHEACRRGYEVLFIKAAKMFRNLLSARADHSWEKRIKRFLTPDLLLIDDFALVALNPTQAEDFYEIVSERHPGSGPGQALKSSILITSNRPPQSLPRTLNQVQGRLWSGDWIALFPDPVMANSALDRLAHQAHHLMIEGGESYRKRLSPKTNG